MQKYLNLIIAVALFSFLGSISAMEEGDLDSKTISDSSQAESGDQIVYLDTIGGVANELWQKILAYLFFDPTIVTQSSDIYEGVKKVERLFSTISCTCVFFSRIKEQFKEESINFYRVHLRDHFLEHRDQDTNKHGSYFKGLYPKNSEWNFTGCWKGYLDDEIAVFMLTNIDNGILPHILGCIKEEPANICLLLIFFGADVNAQNKIDKNNTSMSALEFAIKGFPKLIPMLLTKGSKLDFALETAAIIDGDNTDMVKFLISRGAVLSEFGRPFLRGICSHGNAEILQIFLAEKADYIKCGHKNEALCAIADGNQFSEKHQKILQILLDEGVNINVLIEHYYWVDEKTSIHTRLTPLMISCVKCFVKKLVRVLLAQGADVNIQNSLKLTALIIAIKRFGETHDMWCEDVKNEVRKKAKKIIKMLLEANADVNVKDNGNQTPLIYAVNTDVEIVQMLLNANADVNARNNDGKTALDLAKEKGNEEIIALLKHHENLLKSQNKQSNESYCLVS